MKIIISTGKAAENAAFSVYGKNWTEILIFLKGIDVDIGTMKN